MKNNSNLKIDRPRILPTAARKVFSGILFDVYQWEQELYDGTTSTFEMLKRPDTVQILAVTENKRIILEKQTQPVKGTFYSLPAGHIEKDSEIVQEGLRELKEETGYEPGLVKLWKSVQPSSKIDYMTHIFVGQQCKKVSDQNQDSGEKIDVSLIKLDELLEMTITRKIKLNELAIEFIHAIYDMPYRQIMESFIFGSLESMPQHR